VWRQHAGAIIVWTDDDIEVHADWLRAYAEAFRANPDLDIFGGSATPPL
jgi:hypothetical protein